MCLLRRSPTFHHPNRSSYEAGSSDRAGEPKISPEIEERRRDSQLDLCPLSAGVKTVEQKVLLRFISFATPQINRFHRLGEIVCQAEPHQYAESHNHCGSSGEEHRMPVVGK